MVRQFDHVTIVVRDPARAKTFFAVLGFQEVSSVVIRGEVFARYMGVPDIEAEHITLALENASPRVEVQLLHYLRPDALSDPQIRDLAKIGWNHVCFAVDDIETELGRVKAAGFQARNDILDFRSHKLVFVEGPEGVTVELSQRQ